jgi:hypothetical protein
MCNCNAPARHFTPTNDDLRPDHILRVSVGDEITIEKIVEGLRQKGFVVDKSVIHHLRKNGLERQTRVLSCGQFYPANFGGDWDLVGRFIDRLCERGDKITFEVGLRYLMQYGIPRKPFMIAIAEPSRYWSHRGHYLMIVMEPKGRKMVLKLKLVGHNRLAYNLWAHVLTAVELHAESAKLYREIEARFAQSLTSGPTSG